MSNTESSNTIDKNYIIVLLLILIVFSFDLVTKILLTNHYDGFTRYSAIPKLGIELFLFYLLFKNKINDKINIIFGASLIGISVISFIVTQNQFDTQAIFQKIYVLNKYLYLFLFATVLLNLEKKKRKEILRNIRNIVLLIGVINGLLMILGLLTDFEILRSYRYTERFGFNGLFVKTSETSYMYILLIITTYYEYINSKRKGLLCLFFIAISLLIGTKAIWLFIILLSIIHFGFHKKKIIKYLARIGMLIGALLSYVFFDHIERIIVNSFSFGPRLFAEHGFLTVLTSGRDLLLTNAMVYVNENWSLLNYVVGGIDLEAYGVEFEFVDIFLFFGILGFVIYILFLKRIFFNGFSSKYKVLLFIALMLVAAFAGNFFMSIICSIFAYTVFQNMAYLHEDDSL